MEGPMSEYVAINREPVADLIERMEAVSWRASEAEAKVDQLLGLLRGVREELGRLPGEGTEHRAQCAYAAMRLIHHSGLLENE